MITKNELDKLELKYRDYIASRWGILQPDGSYKHKESWGNSSWDALTWRKIIVLRHEVLDYIASLQVGDTVDIIDFGRASTATITKLNYSRKAPKRLSSIGVDILCHYSQNCTNIEARGKEFHRSGVCKIGAGIHDAEALGYRGVEINNLLFYLSLWRTGWTSRGQYEQNIWALVDSTDISKYI